jgi:hypothetical protein
VKFFMPTGEYKDVEDKFTFLDFFSRSKDYWIRVPNLTFILRITSII